MQGPQLANSVADVFLRFRESPNAVIGNNKAMFPLMFVDERDHEALRFLGYPDDDISKPSIDYSVKTHVFDAQPLPNFGAFALQMTAEENAVNADPSVAETNRE